MARLRAHLTYANVTATLALFLALGGVSWAAVTLPKGSVGPSQLRNGAVGEKKLSKAVRTKLAARGPAGAAGAKGPPARPARRAPPDPRVPPVQRVDRP